MKKRNFLAASSVFRSLIPCISMLSGHMLHAEKCEDTLPSLSTDYDVQESFNLDDLFVDEDFNQDDFDIDELLASFDEEEEVNINEYNFGDSGSDLDEMTLDSFERTSNFQKVKAIASAALGEAVSLSHTSLEGKVFVDLGSPLIEPLIEPIEPLSVSEAIIGSKAVIEDEKLRILFASTEAEVGKVESGSVLTATVEASLGEQQLPLLVASVEAEVAEIKSATVLNAIAEVIAGKEQKLPALVASVELEVGEVKSAPELFGIPEVIVGKQQELSKLVASVEADVGAVQLPPIMATAEAMVGEVSQALLSAEAYAEASLKKDPVVIAEVIIPVAQEIAPDNSIIAISEVDLLMEEPIISSVNSTDPSCVNASPSSMSMQTTAVGEAVANRSDLAVFLDQSRKAYEPIATLDGVVAMTPEIISQCVSIDTLPVTCSKGEKPLVFSAFTTVANAHSSLQPTRPEVITPNIPLLLLGNTQEKQIFGEPLQVASSQYGAISSIPTAATKTLLGANGGRQVDALLNSIPNKKEFGMSEELIIADAELILPKSEPEVPGNVPAKNADNSSPFTEKVNPVIPLPIVPEVIVPVEAPPTTTVVPVETPSTTTVVPVETPSTTTVVPVEVPSNTPIPVETSAPKVPVAPTPPPSTEPIPVPSPILINPPAVDSDGGQSQSEAGAKQPGTNAETPQKQGFLINFNNVSIIEYIRFISKITARNFIFNESDLDFGVTIISEEPATIDDIMTALLQELRIHQLSLMEQGNNIIIHRNPDVKSPAKVVAEGTVRTSEQSKGSDLITSVFRLNTIPAAQISAIVAPLLSSQAIVEATKDSGHLIVTDLKTNIDKIAELVRNLDSPMGGLEIGQYVVRGGSIDGLINVVQKILSPIAQEKTLTFVPHGPSNSVYIISSPYLVQHTIAMMEHIDMNSGATGVLTLDQLAANRNLTQEAWMESQAKLAESQAQLAAEKLSAEAGGSIGIMPGSVVPGAVVPENNTPSLVGSYPKWNPELPPGHIENTQFYIHKLQYRKGDQITAALRRIAESMQQSPSSNADLLVTINSVQWLEAPNSLVMTGTPIALEKIRELIAEVDVPLRQVFVEMLILDTNIEDSLTYGVDVGTRFGGPTSAGAQAFLDSPSILPGALNTATLPTTMGGTGPVLLDPSLLSTGAAGFGIGVMGRNIFHGNRSFSSLGALVKSIHIDNTIKILLNPKLLVEDNTTAEIFVGINTPFQTQTVVNNLGVLLTSNFEYRDVGTRFKVTPLMGNSDIITLIIEEEVSTIDLTAGVTPNAGPTTRKSNSTTRVHIPNEYFLVMSGIIQDEDDISVSQLPCLGGIPILGAALKNMHHADNKRNLLIFLRPRIIDTEEEMDDITKRQQDIFIERSRHRNRWTEEVNEGLEFVNLTCEER